MALPARKEAVSRWWEQVQTKLHLLSMAKGVASSVVPQISFHSIRCHLSSSVLGKRWRLRVNRNRTSRKDFHRLQWIEKQCKQLVKTNLTCPMGGCTNSIKQQCKWMKIASRDHLLASKSVRRQIRHWILLRKVLVNSSLTSNHLHRLTINFKHWAILKFLQT